ncbi:MAG: biotin/lipoyl-binding protein [Phycisphaerae bacterium]|nr:biotin/lipoyl-binding protein [Phycisphaerae bacterium]
MFRRITVVLSILGLAMALYVVATAKQEIPSPMPAQPPSTNPYASGVAALGVVEPASRSVSIAAPEAGRVVEVMVGVNDRVKKGDALFRLDPVAIESERVRAVAARDAAAADVTRIRSWPRAEDFPPVEAEVAEAAARLADAESRFENISAAMERGAASDDELSRQRFLVSILRASLTNARARLERMRSGSWSQDLAVAEAAQASKEAEIRAIDMRLERLTVRSPIDGTVMKRNIEPGEYVNGGSVGASGSASADAPLVVGDLSVLHVWAQVDEEDMPIVRLGAKAVARIRGSLKIEVPLTMIRIEPLAGPKRQITGASTELIDTRVVEVVFRAEVPEGGPRLYPGQVVDVYIDTGVSSADARP